MVVAIPAIAAAAAAGGGAVAAGATTMTALTVASMAMSAVGMATSAIVQGQQQSAMMKYQAQVAANQATAAQQWAGYEASRQSEKSRKLIGTQEAMLASTGAIGTEGSPLAIMANTAANAELDRLGILHQGQLGYLRGQSAAAGYEYSASNASSTAMMKAGTSLLGGATQIAASNPGWFQGGGYTPEPITNTTEKYVAASGIDY